MAGERKTMTGERKTLAGGSAGPNFLKLNNIEYLLIFVH
jgi:hypothetical protein